VNHKNVQLLGSSNLVIDRTEFIHIQKYDQSSAQEITKEILTRTGKPRATSLCEVILTSL